MKYSSIKPKYANGGSFLSNNSGLLEMGATLLSNTGGTGKTIGNIGKGVLAGAAAGPAGMIIGGGLGLIQSIFGNKQKKEQLELERIQEEKARGIRVDNISAANSAGYATSGINTSYYAKGGVITPEYEVEKDEVVQGNALLEEGTELASDLQLVGGEKHTNGGTEGKGGDRVFSDQIKVDKSTREILKDLNIKLPSKATYAKAAEIVGKNKGKAEEKIQSKMKPSINTGKRMLEESNTILDNLFSLQEMNKPQSSVVKNYALGGVVTDPRPVQNLLPSKTSIQPIAINNKIPSPSLQGGYSGVTIPTKNSVFSNALNTAKNFIKNNEGQLINAVNYAANLNTNKKLRTDVDRTYLSAPSYNYVDRSGVATRNNNLAYRNTLQALQGTSAGVNASNAGAIYAATLDRNSQIHNAENQRRDQYNDNYARQGMQVNAMNADIRNQASDLERELYNQKYVVNPLNARNAFMSGYAGNSAMSQQRKLQETQLLLSALVNDNNGVLSRLSKEDLNKVKNLGILDLFKR